MSFNQNQAYTCTVSGQSDDTFSVVEFSASEGLSRLFEYEVICSSTNANIDLSDVVGKSATFTYVLEDTSYPVAGMIASADVLNQTEINAYYRLLLVPPLWLLTLSSSNRVFLSKSIPDIIEEVLQANSLTSTDYAMDLSASYDARDFVCQYNENDFEFISRWMEHFGIYYYFEQSDNGVKAVFVDNMMKHVDLSNGNALSYIPPSALETEQRENIVFGLTSRRQRLPGSVQLKDYNDQKPDLDVTGSATLDSNDSGEQYAFADHFDLPDDGATLASIRKEEMLAKQEIFQGESGAPQLRSGYLFTLDSHFRDAYNQTYLITEISHQGRQPVANAMMDEDDKGLMYSNSFTAIVSDVQYRPPCISRKSRIYGTMSAVIDASSDSDYAEIDDQGRYKVILPFDLSDPEAGKASHYIRLLQPYGGDGYGFHYPLHKGTPVLLTFLGGDPDRPVIAGFAPNATNASLLVSETQTRAGFQTAGGSIFGVEDIADTPRISIQAGDDTSSMLIGSTSDARIDLTSEAIGAIAEESGSFLGSSQAHIQGGSAVTIASGDFLQDTMDQAQHNTLDYNSGAFSTSQSEDPATFSACVMDVVNKAVESAQTTASSNRVSAIDKVWNGSDMIGDTLQGEKSGVVLLRDGENKQTYVNVNPDNDDILLDSDKGSVVLHGGADVQLVADENLYAAGLDTLKVATANGHLMFKGDDDENTCQLYNNATIETAAPTIDLIATSSIDSVDAQSEIKMTDDGEVTVTSATLTTKQSGAITIESTGDGLTIKTAGGSIKITDGGAITVTAGDATSVNSSGDYSVNSSKSASISASSTATLSGSTSAELSGGSGSVTANGSGVSVSGSLIQLG